MSSISTSTFISFRSLSTLSLLIAKLTTSLVCYGDLISPLTSIFSNSSVTFGYTFWDSYWDGMSALVSYFDMVVYGVFSVFSRFGLSDSVTSSTFFYKLVVVSYP